MKINRRYLLKKKNRGGTNPQGQRKWNRRELYILEDGKQMDV